MEDKPNLNPDDFEGYGEEMKDMVNTVNKTMDENKNLKEQVSVIQDNIIRTSEEALLSSLNKAVPDWETINKDQKWLNWLAEPDPLTGVRRQDLLDDAYQARDSVRVATFFNSWKGGGPGHSGPSSSNKPKISRQEYNQAIKDATTGRLSEKEFEKIANDYQRQFGGA